MVRPTIMLLMIFLALGASSCGTTQKIVCKQVKTYEMKPKPLCDISFQFARCRCRCLDPNTFRATAFASCPQINEKLDPNEAFAVIIDKGEEAKNFPIEYCEGIGGFFLEDIASEIRPKIGALNQIKKDYCN